MNDCCCMSVADCEISKLVCCAFVVVDCVVDGSCGTPINDCCCVSLVDCDCDPFVIDCNSSVGAIHHCTNQFSPSIPAPSRHFPIDKSFGIKC